MLSNLFFAIYVIISSQVVEGSLIIDINKIKNRNDSLLIFSVPMVLFYIVLPLIMKIKVEKVPFQDIGLIYRKSKLSLGFIVTFSLILITLIIKSYTMELPIPAFTIILSFMIVAIAEEIMLRGIIQHEVEKIFNPVISVFITSLIFAFIYHSGGDVYDNLFIRFSIGLILGFIRLKTGSLYNSILFHWVYNIFVTIM